MLACEANPKTIVPGVLSGSVSPCRRAAIAAAAEMLASEANLKTQVLGLVRQHVFVQARSGCGGGGDAGERGQD